MTGTDILNRHVPYDRKARFDLWTAHELPSLNASTPCHHGISISEPIKPDSFPSKDNSKEKDMLRRILPVGLTLYIAFVFIQSLFFKFTDSPETQYIFGTLEAWGTSLGWPGLFSHQGIFSQYVVGTGELIASILLLAGLTNRFPTIRVLGAAMAMGVISGAIFFHLFTPLGVSVLNADGTHDGGELFVLACGVWLASAALLWLGRDTFAGLIPQIRKEA